MVSSLFSRRAGPRRAVWGNSDSAPPTAPSVTSSSVEEQFPRLQVVPTERSPPTSQQSTVSSRATPRFSLPPRRRKSPVALDDSKTVTMVDASLTATSVEDQFPCLPTLKLKHTSSSSSNTDNTVDRATTSHATPSLLSRQIDADTDPLNSSSSSNNSSSNNNNNNTGLSLNTGSVTSYQNDDTNCFGLPPLRQLPPINRWTSRTCETSQPSDAPSANPPVPPRLELLDSARGFGSTVA